MSVERMRRDEWAQALCEAIGFRRYLVGSFALALANAALVADSGNLARIGQGFPGLAKAMSDYREYGSAYLEALADGDESALETAREHWLARQG